MTTTPDGSLLDRVRKLLAKAEDEGCSPAEAEALTAKAAELMARYGIDRALLGALHPETDQPADRVFTLGQPLGRRQAAPAGRARAGAALPVRANPLPGRHPAARLRLHLRPGARRYPVHLAARADGPGPGQAGGARLRRRRPGHGGARGCSATARGRRHPGPRRRGGRGRIGVRGRGRAPGPPRAGSRPRWSSPDRSLVVRRQVAAAYPRLRKTRVTYSGGGYGDGYREGQKADIGGSSKISMRTAGALPR